MKKLSLWRAMLYGVAGGTVVSVIGPVMTGGVALSEPALLIATVAGGAIFGLLLGLAIALINNGLIKPDGSSPG